ncbi:MULTISPECIES: hypothetical protein [Natrialbaceae]|uniref:hypothetical protein n=1 Tax=Natrialbaceae TaxID=1644061 RepID=UPI00207C8805|nr:hypothetical protein [Natronococcus sp. CG52]
MPGRRHPSREAEGEPATPAEIAEIYLRFDDTGLATGGLLVRHLVTPNPVEGAKRALEFVAGEISEATFVDVRPITEEEYEEVFERARDSGLERLYLDRSMLADRDPGSTGSF